MMVSRDLLGLAFVAILCLAISPFYKTIASQKLQTTTDIVPVSKVPTAIRKASKPKTIVFLSDSFLPVTFAGSELSGYETIRYMRSKGHTVIIFLTVLKVDNYDGFPIYKFDLKDPFCKNTIRDADAIFYQMDSDPLKFDTLQERKGHTYLFIHVVSSYVWLLQNKVNFPITVVYNSEMTKNLIPSFYDSMTMIPYVDTAKFKPLRSLTIENNVVCLINCNPNKGGILFKDLARSMPDVQFLGVKGGYANQITEDSLPNLTYIETQKDIRVVFKKIGILLMPSRNETWGRTAVEAMASGVPVIHSESAGLIECCGGAGITCMRNDLDAWAEAIRRIIREPGYRQRLRENGFKRVEEITMLQDEQREELAVRVEQ